MSILVETSLGDITIDLDVEASPLLCKNLLKLAKARYYTNTLVYNVQEGRFCQIGDPRGDGTGGCCIDGLIDVIANFKRKDDVRSSAKRFLRSTGRVLSKKELKEKGRVVAIEMGMKDTIGSQFMITIDSGQDRALDGLISLDESIAYEKEYLSLGIVTEDDMDVLGKLNGIYCDKTGRPYADVRIKRMHILEDPFDDPDGLELVLSHRGVTLMEQNDLPEGYKECARWLSSASPSYEKPKEEIVEMRISTEEAVKEVDEETEKKRSEEISKKEDRSNAIMLEMLGDLPSADMKPPENVLFVCKLNSVTEDEDLELIFSRFDPNAKAEIIRDPDTGDSLQYAFVEFDTEQACNEAYFKMNNALIDDRRIKVDFSQSVAKEWNRYAQRKRGGHPQRSNSIHPHLFHDGRTDNRHMASTGKSTQRRYDSYGRAEQQRSRSFERNGGQDKRQTRRPVSNNDDRNIRDCNERRRSRSSEWGLSRDSRKDRHRTEKCQDGRSKSRRNRRNINRSRSISSDRFRYRKNRSRSVSTSSSTSRSRDKRKRRRKDKERRHRGRSRDRRKKRRKTSSRKYSGERI